MADDIKIGNRMTDFLGFALLGFVVLLALYLHQTEKNEDKARTYEIALKVCEDTKAPGQDCHEFAEKAVAHSASTDRAPSDRAQIEEGAERLDAYCKQTADC